MKRLSPIGGLAGFVSVSVMVIAACSSPNREMFSGQGASATTTSGSGGACSGSSFVGGVGGGEGFDVGALTEATRHPPPLSGGTLIISADGKQAVASDPDRDRVYVVDIAEQDRLALRGQIELPEGAQPGRLVEDSEGRVHVALRGTGEVVSIDVATLEVLETRTVCDNPRGIAYDAANGLLHVACAEGLLKTLPADGGQVTRVLNLGEDLRDVMVVGDELYVSRFRSAELAGVSQQDEILFTTKPPSLTAPALVNPCAEPEQGSQAPSEERRRFEPHVAWRTVAFGGDLALMVHQREQVSALDLDGDTSGSGYASGSLGCLGVVQSVATVLSPYGEPVAFRTFPGAVLPVDLAVSSDQSKFAIVAAGTNDFSGNLLIQDLASYETGAMLDDEVSSEAGACADDFSSFQVEGQPTSVAFLPDDRVVVLTRQPARLHVVDASALGESVSVQLSDIDVSDTGYRLFHSDVGGGIACASCHPEARDDGNVWSFTGIGKRRTQNIGGGILGTEPFHWEGDLEHFGDLVNEVMVRRMHGPRLSAEYVDSLAHWVDAQPALRRTRFDEAAAARGEALFQSSQTGCSTCHSGAKFTNDLTVDVGTGLMLQVPSLVGVSFRAPYMHDGCAPTLRARFGACGGGDLHGTTSELSDDDVSDLVEYMKTL